jgi:hypothetical protein
LILRRFGKRTVFVNGYMVRFAAFDLILGIIRSGVMGISFVVKVFGVDLCDRSGDVAGFGVPGDVVADFEGGFHMSGFVV